MSRWTHPQCLPCWRERNPGRDPVRAGDERETCCWCKRPTTHGIYVRENPDALPNHHDHEDA